MPVMTRATKATRASPWRTLTLASVAWRRDSGSDRTLQRATVGERGGVEVDGVATLGVHVDRDPALARAVDRVRIVLRGAAGTVVEIHPYPARDVATSGERRQKIGAFGGDECDRRHGDVGAEQGGVLVLVETDDVQFRHGQIRIAGVFACAASRAYDPFAPYGQIGEEAGRAALDEACAECRGKGLPPVELARLGRR